jgi:hypothetical protein
MFGQFESVYLTSDCIKKLICFFLCLESERIAIRRNGRLCKGALWKFLYFSKSKLVTPFSSYSEPQDVCLAFTFLEEPKEEASSSTTSGSAAEATTTTCP